VWLNHKIEGEKKKTLAHNMVPKAYGKNFVQVNTEANTNTMSKENILYS